MFAVPRNFFCFAARAMSARGGLFSVPRDFFSFAAGAPCAKITPSPLAISSPSPWEPCPRKEAFFCTSRLPLLRRESSLRENDPFFWRLVHFGELVPYTFYGIRRFSSGREGVGSPSSTFLCFGLKNDQVVLPVISASSLFAGWMVPFSRGSFWGTRYLLHLSPTLFPE